LRHIIIIIGPKGSGKTTLGRALAEKMGVRYLMSLLHSLYFLPRR
jgi:shikimate kinase